MGGTGWQEDDTHKTQRPAAGASAAELSCIRAQRLVHGRARRRVGRDARDLFSEHIPSDDTITCTVPYLVTATLPEVDLWLHGVVYTSGGLGGTI